MYSIIDLETLYNKENEEKILSLALFRYENNEISDQLISILNPEAEVSERIEERIGLSNKRLQKVPKFYEIAKRILELIEDTVLVGFDVENQFLVLRNEFEKLGFSLEIERYDLKKELQKEFQSKTTLVEIYKGLGIPYTTRFSNKLNGLAMVKLFRLVQEKNFNKKSFSKINDLEELEPNLFRIQRDLPYELGLFYVHNKKGEVVFLEKAKDINVRVNQIFTLKSDWAEKIKLTVDRITFDNIGSDLIASIREQLALEKLQPIFNEIQDFEILEDTLFDESQTFLIQDVGRRVGENSFVLVKKGVIEAYGYYELNHQINELKKIEKISVPIIETKKVRSLVYNFIKQKKQLNTINFE